MSESETVKLVFDKEVEFLNETGEQEQYAKGEHELSQEKANLFLHMEGVRLPGEEGAYASTSLPKINRLYSINELVARQQIALTGKKNNIPQEALNIALFKTDDDPITVQAYVDAICKTNQEFWVEKARQYETEKIQGNRFLSKKSTYYETIVRGLAKVQYETIQREIALAEEENYPDKWQDSDTFPNEFLKYRETWEPLEALLLICGLNPEGAFTSDQEQFERLDPKRFRFFKRAGELDYLGGPDWFDYRAGSFSSFGSWFFSYEASHLLRNNPDSFEHRTSSLKEATAKVLKLLEYWKARKDPDARLTPQECIDWALSKDCEIVWLDWAIEEGYITQTEPAVPKDKETITLQSPSENQGIVRMVTPKTKDDWYEVIRECVRKFEGEYQSTPSETQLWNTLVKKPPPGYEVGYDDRVKSLTMADAKPLDRENHKKRYARYLPPDTSTDG